MLLKLLKYEGMVLGRLLLPFDLLCLVLIVLERYILVDSGLVLAMLWLTIMTSFFAHAVLVVRRFYCNFFHDEGYLTFTLPAKAWQHVLAKFLCAVFFLVLGYYVIQFTLGIVEEDGMFAVLEAIQEFHYAGLRHDFIARFGAVIMAACSYCLFMYFCIVVGRYWRNHPVLGAVLTAILVKTLLFIFISGSVISDIFFNLVYLGVTCWLLEHKLNLT